MKNRMDKMQLTRLQNKTNLVNKLCETNIVVLPIEEISVPVHEYVAAQEEVLYNTIRESGIEVYTN